jgi:hypothetical protein
VNFITVSRAVSGCWIKEGGHPGHRGRLTTERPPYYGLGSKSNGWWTGPSAGLGSKAHIQGYSRVPISSRSLTPEWLGACSNSSKPSLGPV